jgi:hypothetical protein
MSTPAAAWLGLLALLAASVYAAGLDARVVALPQ